MKKTTLLVACLAVLLLPLAASAYSVKKGDSIYVPKEEVIEGNLYAVGSNLTIEGKVTGDVICAGQSVNINGDVAGDVICAGQSISINGKIGGNLRVVGNTVNFNGQVARNGITVGATVVTSASSTIGWDLLVLGNIFELRGNIGRDFYGSAGKVNVAGQIGKNLNLNFGSQNNYDKPLVIANTAKINGNVTYKSGKDAAVDAGAVIKGETIHNFPAVVNKKSNAANLGWWWGKLISIFSALVIGLVIISFWREQIIKTTDLMLAKVGPALGWGVLALFLTPLIFIVLLITIIGLPLAFITLGLWLIAIYLSKILVGILIGRSLLNNYWAKQKDSLILAMVVGIIVAYLIFALPFIGWIVALLAMLWGLGGIMLSFKKA
ncbi:MAG: polymer-forming cytoskeletal protein [Patescibacteria group bacterium]|nr:polymer-forming cytoskeletal protein [Patescibacteria group bacterium]